FISLRNFHVALFGHVPTKASVWDLTLRIYEQLFGRTTTVGELSPAESDILLTAILPLPRPRHNTWPNAYHQWWPDGAKKYVAHARPRMAQRLIDRVTAYKPAVVLLHGKTQHRKWTHAHGHGKWTVFRLGHRPNETAELILR